MSKILISGGNKLYGKVRVQSAKNCLLPLIACTIMLEGKITFTNCPKIEDVTIMCEIVKSLGGKYEYKGDNLQVDCSSLYLWELPKELTQKIRASIFMTGPLISRFRKAVIHKPGGCNIGDRPIDIHLEGLKKLGVEISGNDMLYCKANSLQGTEITLRYKSVGATENLIMASVMAKGITTIKNCACEPEIKCLANFINILGGKVSGAGTSTIVIEGVEKLSKENITYLPISDRIEVGTFMLAVTQVGGEIEIENANARHNKELIKKLFNNTCKITTFNDKIYIKSSGIGKGLGSVLVAPYPSFPTDLQSPLMAYATTLKGITIIKEEVFPSRFKQASELIKMGADIKINKNVAIVNGVNSLEGAFVTAYDLRGGASMVLAGLKANGITIVDNAEIISRGYYNLEKKLTNLGAFVKRIE